MRSPGWTVTLLPPARRRGLGSSLLLVLGLTLVLSITAFSVGDRSRDVSAQVRRSARELQGESLARMANLAALRYLRRHSDQTGSEVHRFLTRPDLPAPLLLDLGDLPHLAAELDRTPGFELSGPVEVLPLRRHPLTLEVEEQEAYELHGMLRITSRISGPASLRTRLVREYPHRNLVVAPPRPFDTLTFFLAEARPLLSWGAWQGDPNRTIEGARTCHQALVRQLREVEEALGSAARGLAAKSEELSGSDQGASMTRALERMSQQLEAESHSQDRAAERIGSHSLPQPGPFPEEACLLSRDPEIDLADLDLPRILRRPLEAWAPDAGGLNPEAESLRLALREALARPKQTQEELQADLSEILDLARRFRQACLPLSETLLTILQSYQRFQDRWEIVSGSPRQGLLGHARRLTRAEQRWRADFVFLGAGAARRARLFLEQRPPPTGVVFVSDPSAPLRLRLGAVEGRLTIASTSPLTVTGARVRDPERDALVLIAYSGLEVRGELQAALVSLGGQLDHPGGDLRGSLWLESLPGPGSLSALLRGRLRSQQGLRSGPAGPSPRPPPSAHALHVLLGPRPLYWRADR